MSRRDINDVQKLVDAVGKIRRLEQMLENLMYLQPLGKISDVYSELQDIAACADQNQDMELLQMLFYKVMPEIDKVDKMYQSVYALLGDNVIEGVGQSLCGKQYLVEALRPNNLMHVAADTTGNAGDYILVRSLKKLVESGTPAELHWSDVNVRAAVTDDFIEACNKSSGVIMGGGGFFLKDTNSNEISGWQWPCSVEDMKRIHTPIYVLGVGYNRFRGQEEFEPYFTESVNALVEQSAFFGLRNYGSIRAIQQYLREDLRDKVKYHPCATTVLAKLYTLPERKLDKPFIALNCAFDRAGMRYGDRQDEIMQSIARVCKKLSADYTIRCYIHCLADELVCPYLDAAEVAYEKTILTKEMSADEYLRYFTEPELVLAVRGHAQMIPFGCKTPAVSIITHDKLQWFLEDIGHPEWGVDVLEPQFEEKLLEKSLYMLANRTEICKEIEAAQEKLWDIMQENLKNITLKEN